MFKRATIGKRLRPFSVITNENQMEMGRNPTVLSKLQEICAACLRGSFACISGGGHGIGACAWEMVGGAEGWWGKGAATPSLFLPTRSSFHLATLPTLQKLGQPGCLLQAAFPDDSNKVESLLSWHFSSHTPWHLLIFCTIICFPFQCVLPN